MSFKTLGLFALALAASVASAGPTTGQTYSISPSAFPDLCAVPDGDYNGALVKVTDCDSSDLIAWVYDGTRLKNSATGRCIDVIDGGHWNGNGIQTWECFDDNLNQRYTPTGGALQWSGQNMCIDLTDGNGSPGNHLQLWQCFNGNTNQQWVFGDVQEVDDCDEPSGSVSASGYASVTPSASASITSPSPSITGNASITSVASTTGNASVSVPAASSTSAIGGEYLAGGNASTSAVSASASNSSPCASVSSTSAGWSQAPSASVSASYSWNASSSASAPVASSTGVPSGGSGNADFSGYLQVRGTNVVNPSGNPIPLKGTNLGGWLVWEDWMCGITDNSGSADRFPQTTLENRFGEDQTRQLMKVWQDNWLVESDFDIMQAMGFNLLRLPFSYRNFKRSDGTYITDSNGNLDLSRLDWAVAQAKSRGMYVVLVYHIWEGQEQGYSTISEDSSEGQNQRNLCGQLWTQIASHFAGESAIAAFDAINEPTGSAGNILQRDLYKAIRAGDANRIIVMESINSAPDSDWTNVMYSMHEYLMMGETDLGYNQYMFQQGVQDDTNAYTGYGVPTYIGEFMASGDTLTWMLQQMNNMGVWWSGWTYKTVNMDRWGLFNFGSQMYVDVSADSFQSLQSAWSNMGGISKSRVADQYAAACGGTANTKRDVLAAPRLEEKRNLTSSIHRSLKRSTPHAGRSRRGVSCQGR